MTGKEVLKKAIEGLGFKYSKHEIQAWSGYKRNNLLLFVDGNMVSIEKKKGKGTDVLFSGIINNKPELEKALKDISNAR